MSTWKRQFLQALLEVAANSDVEAGTVRYALMASTYTYSDAHDFFDDISTHVIGTPVLIDPKTYTDGSFGGTVADYDGTELDGETADSAYIYLDTGTPATSRLMYYLDDSPLFPLTGEGEDQPITLSPLPIGISSGSGNDIWYPNFLEALLTRPANSALSGTLRVVGLTAGYTYSAAHEFLSDVGANTTGTAQTIGSKTYADGVLDGADATFPGSPGLTACVAFLVYLDTGTAGTSRLVALKRNVQGLPGGGLTTSIDQPLRWNNAGSGIMRLGAATA